MAKNDKSEKAEKPAKAKAERSDRPKAATTKGKGDKAAAPKAEKAADKAKSPATAAKAKATATAAKPAARTRGDKDRAARPARGKRTTEATTAAADAELPLPGVTLDSEPVPTAGFVVDPAVEEAPPATVEAVLADDDEDAVHDRIVHEAELPIDEPSAAPEPAPLSPEEQELAALYGDELAAAPPAAAHGEFSDRRTADEDRPMMPEINGRQERQKKWEERRDERRLRREQERQRRREQRGGGQPSQGGQGGQGERRERPDFRERDRDRDRGGERERDRDATAGAAVTPSSLPAIAPVAAAPVSVEGAHGVLRVGNELGDAAWSVFSSIRGAQPMPVRQLAGMMRKRGLLDADPEQAWPHLKAALIGDERSYRALGLRPRIVYRGRDLFGPGPVAQSATAGAEAELARALSVMAVATHQTLKQRLAQASQAGFERLAHAYLVSAGFRDIAWIKQVEGISYATALPPEGTSTVLVSARSGDTPVDRRGVGELRVGVEAKGLLAGYLLAARELSAEAERELERPGRSLTMLVGDSFISALLAAGVGVVTAAAPVRYVDDQLLGELLAG